eukprot:CAMPEP_0172496608 /NCGR_PEP_ID=MMETSP1066-20121228/90035_1 /TAXON_ID=671091 /ORGANISM="Coscinodiscus wailesii, Strain CCMP2513" /LENGTH=77 /DNA_ID=CAMNT_0013268983 /DNA_START=137 /DNA_END=370 /DNA_ORIENTATION=+
MKINAIALLALPALSSAFTARPYFGVSCPTTTSLNGKGAKSAEEDLEMTRKVIMEHIEAEIGEPSEDEKKESAESEE